MSKSLLISSSLLLAAGCTTAGTNSSEEALHFDATASMSLLGGGGLIHPTLELPLFNNPGEDNGENPVEEPLTDEEIIDSMVDAVVTFAEREKFDAVLAMRSYALPLRPDGPLQTTPSDCGTAPAFESLQVLDSECPDVDNRWGWEIEVENCDVGGEEFSGVMQVTYAELREYSALFPQQFVEMDAIQALARNSEGSASLRYALNVSSPTTELSSCGEEFGPAEFRATDRDTIRFSNIDESVERLSVQGMQHQMPAGTAAEGTILSNRDGYLELMELEGEPVIASFLTAGVVAQQGDLWPTRGSIEAHVEKQGVVRLRFSPQTAVDGTVEIDTPLGIQLATLTMD